MGRVAVAVIVSLWVIPISLLVNHIVPESYMDEIFHIPQAQQYCKGNFKSWDPMITTPPGLYYLSLANIACLFPGMFFAKKVNSVYELCSVPTLRFTNAFLAVISSVLVYEILTTSRPALTKRQATLQAIMLSLYPLHWFFTFLYYTDVASLTVVLAMHLACLKRQFQLSALLGALAIFIRQTNVVWMVLVASTGILDYVMPSYCKKGVQPDDHYVSTRKNEGLAVKGSVSIGPILRKRNSDSSPKDFTIKASPQRGASGFFDEVYILLARLWLLRWEVFASFGPFLLVLLGFISFVYWNGSVVLGAKDAHAVSPHFAQILYFGLASVLAMAPFSLSFNQVSGLCRSLWMNKLPSFFKILTGLTAGFIFVHFFSIEHAYLLADNRHYTFYIWRKVVKFNWLMKYLLLPLYVFSWLTIFNILGTLIIYEITWLVDSKNDLFVLSGKVQKKVWLVIYFLACASVLVPAPLIEFRYYTIPFYFLILHSQISDTRKWLLMGFIYVAVNIFTMKMFLFRPFHWNHEAGIQRFIW